MPFNQHLYRLWFLAAVLIGLLACAANARAQAPCAHPEVTDQTFGYAEERRWAGDIITARAMLEPLLADCDETVRNAALNDLDQLPTTPRRFLPPAPRNDPPPPPPSCPGFGAWRARFDLVTRFQRSGDTAAALALLQAALSDCDGSVQKTARILIERLSSPPPPVNACGDPAIWNERFAYAEKLRDTQDNANAQALLVPALGDCHAEIRDRALQFLTSPPPPPSTGSWQCPGIAAWGQRFSYAEALRRQGNAAGASAILVPALSDCDRFVRNTALEKLEALTPRPAPWHARLWAAPIAQLQAIWSTIAKVLLPLFLLYVGMILVSGLGTLWTRKNLVVDALGVVGGNFDGKSFGSVATLVSTEMNEMVRSGTLGQHTGRANVATELLAEQANQVTAIAQAVGGDGWAKIVTLLTAMATLPRYRCSGSIFINGEQAQIRISLKRRFILRRWRRFPPFWPGYEEIGSWSHIVAQPEIEGALAPLGYAMLRGAARDMQTSLPADENTWSIETADYGVFKQVLAAVLSINVIKTGFDRTLLVEASQQLREAGQSDPDYLLPPYYLATVEDLLGNAADAVQLLDRLSTKALPDGLGAEVELSKGIEQYHLYTQVGLNEAVAILLRLSKAGSAFDRSRAAIAERARAILAQIYATQMIPQDPDRPNLADIEALYREALRFADGVIKRARPRARLFGRPRQHGYPALANNARGLAKMYYSDFSIRGDEQIKALREALHDLSVIDAAQFGADPTLYCDIGSCLMRLAYWTGDGSLYAQAEQKLNRVLQLRPGYGFALFELGRIWRLRGQFTGALRYFAQALDVREAERDVTDIRVHREIRLADARETRYP